MNQAQKTVERTLREVRSICASSPAKQALLQRILKARLEKHSNPILAKELMRLYNIKFVSRTWAIDAIALSAQGSLLKEDQDEIS